MLLLCLYTRWESSRRTACPISLLNVEVKVLAWVLESHIMHITESLVAADQSGFMPHRAIRHNPKCLFSCLFHRERIGEPVVILSFDAEKAFDSLEWPYLPVALEKMVFGRNFLGWVRLLYQDPVARV